MSYQFHQIRSRLLTSFRERRWCENNSVKHLHLGICCAARMAGNGNTREFTVSGLLAVAKFNHAPNRLISGISCLVPMAKRRLRRSSLDPETLMSGERCVLLAIRHDGREGRMCRIFEIRQEKQNLCRVIVCEFSIGSYARNAHFVVQKMVC